MKKEQCRKWLENKGYKVVYQMGSYPCSGHYIADGGTWLGRYTADTLNGLYNLIRRRK